MDTRSTMATIAVATTLGMSILVVSTPAVQRRAVSTSSRTAAWGASYLPHETYTSTVQVGNLTDLPDQSQWYFWTTEWQDQENTARAELESGNYLDFEDASGLVAWLHDDAA